MASNLNVPGLLRHPVFHKLLLFPCIVLSRMKFFSKSVTGFLPSSKFHNIYISKWFLNCAPCCRMVATTVELCIKSICMQLRSVPAQNVETYWNNQWCLQLHILKFVQGKYSRCQIWHMLENICILFLHLHFCKTSCYSDTNLTGKLLQKCIKKETKNISLLLVGAVVADVGVGSFVDGSKIHLLHDITHNTK